MKKVKGNITTPKGFLTTGAHVGLKKRRKDLALLWSDVPAQAVAVFTTNLIKAAPILWCQQVLANHQSIRGIVINSGNANACTGPQGEADTQAMALSFAQMMDCLSEEILVASTGVIGVPLPIEVILNGIKQQAPHLSASQEAGSFAAEAIRTTDSFTKEIAIELMLGGVQVHIGGMAKGSGMIHPNMATMLGFLTTDANISHHLLEKTFKEIVSLTFNMISVDGDTSTNDMAVILANGLAKNPMIDEENEDYDAFKSALLAACQSLAKAIASDGEGATKLIEVNIKGAQSDLDAQKLSKSIITSNLVKTAFFGADANWGRILAAMGYAGAPFDPSEMSIYFQSNAGLIALMEQGIPQRFQESEALNILQEKQILIQVLLNDGPGKATAWGCDLSEEYVRINGSYRT